MRLPRSVVVPFAAVATAIAIGPFFAGIIIALFAFAVAVSDGALDWYGIGSYCLLMIGLAYVIGWPIALAAGIFVGLWGFVRSINIWVVISAAAIASLFCEVLGDYADIRSGDWTMFQANLSLSLGLAVWAAICCWLFIGRPLTARIDKQILTTRRVE